MLLLLMYNIIRNHVTAEPPLPKQVNWSSSYFLFFIKHSNPFVKTQAKTALHRLPWNQCTLLRTTIFFCPQTQNMDQALKVNVLVTQQFPSTVHWPLSRVNTSNTLQFANHKALCLQEAPVVYVFTQTSKSYQNKHWWKGKVKGPGDERSKSSKRAQTVYRKGEKFHGEGATWMHEWPLWRLLIRSKICKGLEPKYFPSRHCKAVSENCNIQKLAARFAHKKAEKKMKEIIPSLVLYK